MQLGMIGLGRMRSTMVERLMTAGHDREPLLVTAPPDAGYEPGTSGPDRADERTGSDGPRRNSENA